MLPCVGCRSCLASTGNGTLVSWAVTLTWKFCQQQAKANPRFARHQVPPQLDSGFGAEAWFGGLVH